ncbi:MAG TPA: tetratricopeptide repeat protein [Planctomycetaceae bacterium]|jgi:tetratricopeptide (TPR) repeat protein|nr:tetratricopeptide repeat protein [Planctomycetaceae bacterium]
MQSQKRRSRSDSATERAVQAPAADAQRPPVWLVAVLIAATLLVYAQAWRFGFVLIDDPIYVSENPHVQAGLTMQNVGWSFAAFRDGNWIPFTWLSLMVDTTVFGRHPGGYHVTNVLLHVANTVLLLAFLARATGNQLRSACVAALFALHPLHVESVAWITERKDVLSTLFGLLSLLAYVSYAKHRGGWRFAACFLCFIASLLSKQTLVTLPFVFLLLDFWPLGRFAERSSRIRVVIEKIPFLAVSAAFSAITMIAQRSGHNVASLSTFPLGTRCLNAIVVYADYLAKTLFPYHLAVFYPHPGEHYYLAIVGCAAALLAVISVAAVVWVRRCPYLFVGWAWYLGTLVPMIGIVQVGRQQMADRYTYFPLIGLFVAVVWLCAELVPAGALRTRVLATAALTILAALAGATFVQAGYWNDSVTLFRHAHECDEHNPVAASALGSTLVAQGETTEGLALLESAVQLAPNDAESRFNLAVGLEKVGRLDAAAEQYEAALALDEWDPRAHTNLARSLWKRHQYREAKAHFLRAIEIDPDHVSAYVNLGALCGETGDFAGAITYNERALALDPTLLICHYNIALALRAQGRLDEAIDRFRYLQTLSPNDVDAERELDRTRAMRRGS